MSIPQDSMAQAASSVYTPEDNQQAERIKRWLVDNKKPHAWLGKKADIPGGTLSQILSGKYASSPTRHLAKMTSVLDTESERLKDGTPGYVCGSVHKLIHVVCDRTRKHQNFGVVTGYVGVGKSRTLREYRATTPLTLLIEVSPNMTPGVLLSELLEGLNAAIPAGLDQKFQALKKVLKGTNYLVIADEAEKMSGMALEYLRRLRDMAQIGIVLVGTEKLTSLIKPQHGQFDQIRSRVGMWPMTIQSISRDDADDMVRAALSDVIADSGELPYDVLEALWAYCEGSARVLNENLIPAIRDYGLGKGPLSGELVHSIAQKVLYMQRPRAAEGGK